MSNVSTRHNVLPFTAGKSEALTGQRLAKIGYKKTKENPNPAQSICVSVPRITDQEITGEIQKLFPIIRDALESLQDQVIRSLYESRECSIDRFSSVSDEEISINACVAFAESARNGGRITKEYLENWFKNELSDSLTIAIAERLGTEDTEDVRIVQALNGYRDLFSSLSGNKTILGAGQIDQLEKIIGLCNAGDSETGTWAQKRLADMSAKNANLSALF